MPRRGAHLPGAARAHRLQPGQLANRHHRAGDRRTENLRFWHEPVRQRHPQPLLGHPRRAGLELHGLPLFTQQSGLLPIRYRPEPPAIRPAPAGDRRIPANIPTTTSPAARVHNSPLLPSSKVPCAAARAAMMPTQPTIGCPTSNATWKSWPAKAATSRRWLPRLCNRRLDCADSRWLSQSAACRGVEGSSGTLNDLVTGFSAGPDAAPEHRWQSHPGTLQPGHCLVLGLRRSNNGPRPVRLVDLQAAYFGGWQLCS